MKRCGVDCAAGGAEGDPRQEVKGTDGCDEKRREELIN